MPLTSTAARQAKPKDKTYKLSDGGGLYLEVQPSGSKYWRLKYRFAGKEKRLALGVYPAVSLADARTGATDARRRLKAGTDPAQHRKDEKRAAKRAHADSFEVVAREWHRTSKAKWTEHHANEVLESLERDIFPGLGHRPVAQIKAPEVLDALRKIEKRGAVEIAHRVRQRCDAVFRYAIACGVAEDNPVASLKGALAGRKKEPRPMLPRADLPAFLAKLDAHQGDPIVRAALGFTVLTMVRTVEARGGRWTEFDFDKAIWTIPAERMKMRAPHVVPLSHQALALLEGLRKITGSYELLFPGRSDHRKPISENTMLYALYRLGYHRTATVHGFRALASTVLNESGIWSADAIERQLAHAEKNKVRAAYHRAEYLEDRTHMMQWWADFLDTERSKATGDNVIALRSA